MAEPLSVVSIETAGPDGRARRLAFEDCRESRLTSASVVKALALEAGQRLDAHELYEALADAEADLAKERALRLLGYRERSTAEVRQRLMDDGYPPDVCHSTVARLAELGLIDDERFAAVFARSRLASGFGPRRIERELRQRGVPDSLAHDVVTEALGGNDEFERAVAALRGRGAQDRNQYDRLVRRLVTKGFSYQAARAAVESVSAVVSAECSSDAPLVDE